ncbi:hypothetical protein ACDW34_12395 [Acinetobacter piscicola]|uniref:hypothetical protein n=1 Tax=Acinetobacter piscicola TaxID=2006115 RepID=UPI0035576E73
MARSRYKFQDHQHPYFMTCTIVHWLPIFSSPYTAKIIMASLKFLHQEKVKIYAWVMLENHIRLIAQSGAVFKALSFVSGLYAIKIQV